MLNTVDFRRENLRRYIAENGGPSLVASKLGYTNPSFLVQMTGPAPIRAVSEKTAREYEQRLNLPMGFFDMACDLPEQGVPMVKPPRRTANPTTSISDDQFEQMMHMVYDLSTSQNVPLSTPKFMALMSHALLLCKRTGAPVTEDDFKPLIELIRPE